MKNLSNKKINKVLLKVFFLIVGTLFILNMIPHVANRVADKVIESIHQPITVNE